MHRAHVAADVGSAQQSHHAEWKMKPGPELPAHAPRRLACPTIHNIRPEKEDRLRVRSAAQNGAIANRPLSGEPVYAGPIRDSTLEPLETKLSKSTNMS